MCRGGDVSFTFFRNLVTLIPTMKTAVEMSLVTLFTLSLSHYTDKKFYILITAVKLSS